MKLRQKRTLRATRVVRAAALGAICATSTAYGGITFNAANATITHDRDTGSATGPDGFKSVPSMATSGLMPVPPTYSYGLSTLTLNTGTSTAAATVGAISNSTTVGYTLAAGTGVSQTDTGNSMSAHASLKIVVDGTWTASSPSFGPTATGYTSFGVAGSVGSGPGDFAKVIINLRWTNTAKTVDYRLPYNNTLNFTTPGSFGTFIFSSLALNSGSLTNGTPVRVSGTIEFQAKDPGETEIIPRDFEISAAPPTSVFSNKTEANVEWNSATNWEIATDRDFVQALVPNAIGVRAKFGENLVAQTVTLADPTTLGTLDFDDSHGILVEANANELTFDTEDGNAVVFARNVNGNGTHIVHAPIVLSTNLELINDSAGALILDSIVSGSGGLIKDGLGTATLIGGAPNSYTGATTVNGGVLNLNKVGAINGGGPVQVQNAILNYNFNGAVGGGVTTQVNANGVVDLGVTPTPSDMFSLQALGAIRGSSSELAALTVGGNLTLNNSAMIVHETFDPSDPVKNPGGIFGPGAPSLIFGIGSGVSFAGGSSIAVGSASSSPWKGFGSDRGLAMYGTASNDIQHSVTMSGASELVSLGGELVLNAQLNGQPGASILKRGAGLVSINNVNNNFNGPVTIAEGVLAVNGALTTSGSGVHAQPHAVLAGKGTINGVITLDLDPSGTDGGHLAPGESSPTYFAPPPFPVHPTVGTLTATSLLMSADAQLDWELDTANILGGTNDLAIITGPMTLNGFLNILDGPNFNEGDYYLIQYNSVQPNDLGIEIGLAPSNYLYNIEVIPGGGNIGGFVVLHVSEVPEPAGLAGLGVALAGMIGRRRRR